MDLAIATTSSEFGTWWIRKHKSFVRYARGVMGGLPVMAHEAEDIVSAVAMKIVAAHDEVYVPTLEALVKTAIRNYVRDCYRKAESRAHFCEVEQEVELGVFLDIVSSRQQAFVYAGRLLTLYRHDPDVFELLVGAGFGESVEALSTTLALPEGTVKSRCRRGRALMVSAEDSPWLDVVATLEEATADTSLHRTTRDRCRVLLEMLHM